MSTVSISIEMGGCMMRHSKAGITLLAMFVSLHLMAQPAVADSPAPPIPETQAKIKRLGFGISEITLLPKAASRIPSRAARAEPAVIAPPGQHPSLGT